TKNRAAFDLLCSGTARRCYTDGRWSRRGSRPFISLGRPAALIARVQLERDSPDHDVVTGLETLCLEGVNHADRLQAAFEVCQGLLVVEVEAGHQPLDPRARDVEGVIARPADLVAPAAPGAKDAVLGELLVAIR